jgi:hypothetical protein
MAELPDLDIEEQGSDTTLSVYVRCDPGGIRSVGIQVEGSDFSMMTLTAEQATELRDWLGEFLESTSGISR